jgi:hypothetical protein
MTHRLALLLVLILSSCLAASQERFAEESRVVAADAARLTAEEPVKLEIVNRGAKRVPEALIQRIFRETVHEVAWQLNPEHPPRILAKVTLRLGEPGFTIETIEGKERSTVLCMHEWDELAFARLVARAARNGLFSDQELDKHARAGLSRARAVTSVTELQGH